MKRALLIGIDDYEHFGKLSGCENDVNAMAPLLSNNFDGSRNFECRAMLSSRDKVDRRSLLEAINELLAPGAQVALLYFAGHGAGLTNDVSLVASDGDWTEPGVALSLLLGKAQNAKIEQVIIILDCCHSGGGGGNPILGADIAILKKGLAVLAASRGDQVAKEMDGRGQFSTYLGGALNGGAADVTGKVSLAGVYAYLAACFGAWDQRPTFKANLEESFELRRTVPLVPLEHLKKLPDIFESPDFVLPLDPTYERESPTRVPEKVAVYEVLSKCRDAKLVEPVGADFLFHAATFSKGCRLTPYGRHYWNLASKRLL